MGGNAEATRPRLALGLHAGKYVGAAMLAACTRAQMVDAPDRSMHRKVAHTSTGDRAVQSGVPIRGSEKGFNMYVIQRHARAHMERLQNRGQAGTAWLQGVPSPKTCSTPSSKSQANGLRRRNRTWCMLTSAQLMPAVIR